MPELKTVLLAGDNPNDVELTLEALADNNCQAYGTVERR
jgi:hypothetical protein